MLDLIWQYKNKPRAKATAELLNNAVYKSFDDALALAEILNIQTATGYALDLIGRHVGCEREQAYFVLKKWFAFSEAESKDGFNAGEFYKKKDALKGSFYLNDSDYRFLIKAKIIKNYQTGTLENMIKSFEFLFNKGVFIFDNYDMSVNLVINHTKLNLFLLKMAIKNDILVRPVGVGFKIILLLQDGFFGFSKNKNSLGFNRGNFAMELQNDI
ncbi:DUF2612 domain-containing protein [Campylobacter sp. faydin G-105]|uniref:DUF2612 domain-containing protein n=1 Tax=Campylobacter anatolicus TaxID=2829105 RepID=UPI001B8E06FE|nr:DUF2612 domain-containing protein [Campylobacter anatolicus]MBR8461466.1 DUF2612 domain-containing protein [Campylobacter anatolicus]